MLLMSRPMQVKPADEDTKIENRKVFVGMLGQVNDEKQVRSLFESFGNIEECHILRDANGKSKGCAFIRFSLQQDAVTAIQALNGSIKMTGASSSLVVRFADSDKDRQLRKLHQSFKCITQQNTAAVAATTTGNTAALNLPMTFQNIFLPHQAIIPTNHNNSVTTKHNINNNTMPYAYGNNFYIDSSSNSILKNPELMFHNNNNTMNESSQPALTLQLTHQHPNFLTVTAGNEISAFVGQDPLQLVSHHQQPQASQQNPPSHPPPQALTFIPSEYPAINPTIHLDNSTLLQQIIYDTISNQHQHPQLSYCWPSAGSTNCMTTNNIIAVPSPVPIYNYEKNFNDCMTNNGVESNNVVVGEKHVSGPPECNLFVMYLPQEYGDRELAALFSRCGTVLSAKVFMDNLTNQSKCFGFVSFDNPHSALCAIETFNGFKIGHKKLKVSIKQQKVFQKNYGSVTTTTNNKNNNNDNINTEKNNTTYENNSSTIEPNLTKKSHKSLSISTSSTSSSSSSSYSSSSSKSSLTTTTITTTTE